jgi:hypothetical protein
MNLFKINIYFTSLIKIADFKSALNWLFYMFLDKKTWENAENLNWWFIQLPIQNYL